MRRILPLFRRSMSESWRGLVGWSLGVAGVLFLYLPLYPSLGSGGELQAVIDSMPKNLVQALGYDELGTGAGYTQATFYGLIGFLLFTIAAVLWASSAIAGAEESGRLELDLAHGVGRVQYVIESTLSVLIRLAILGAVAATIVWALNDQAELELSLPNIIGATAALVGLSFLSATTGLLVGGLVGRTSWATGAGATVAVLGYVFQAVGRQSEDLDWLTSFSPYSWVYDRPPLLDGADGAGLALVWSIALLLTAGAASALHHRDITG